MPETPTHERPIDRVIDRLARGGYQPTENGPSKWKSRCPSHKGSSFNLSIEEASDGKVLLNCHHVELGRQTCSASSIARELGLTLGDLFVRTNRPARSPKKPHLGKPHETPEAAIASIVKRLGEPTACWVYEELHGTQRFPLMHVYRFEKDGNKEFRPIHPTAEGWYLGDPAGKLPLYRLPEIPSAEAVVVVEGEKCCDLVRMLGLVATTSAHGAKSPAKTDWSPLAGKLVIIIPDNDEAGEAYALAVATILSQLDPRPRIRILRLPLAEKGDDIEQWLTGVVPDNWDLVDCREELQRLWSDAPLWIPPPGSVPPAATAEEETPLNLTEWGNARRLAKAYGDKIRFCYSRGEWMVWDGQRYVADNNGEVWRYAKTIPRLLMAEAAKEYWEDRESILKWALRCESKKVLQASIDLTWSEPGIGVGPDDFDRDPWMLNCPNGVVDLLTGEIRPQRPEDLLSKMTSVPYEPQRDCPRWKNVIAELFDDDEEMIAYIQRAAGYSITGDTGEHALFLCDGTGRNGKNTVLDTIRDVAGDYGTVADPRIFLTDGQTDHPAGLATLAGRRIVVTSEVDVEKKLAEGLVKRVTGDRTISARFMHQNPFEFEIHFKIWMLANSKPDITGQDQGIWSRIRVIPFNVFIPPEKRIKGLSEILVKEEGPGILAWLVEGCREWHRIGLQEPKRVLEAVENYRSDQDVVGDFLAQCTVSYLDHPELRTRAKVKAGDLYKAYMDWCTDNGERFPMANRKFGIEITKRGHATEKSNSVAFKLGLALIKEPHSSYREKDSRDNLY